MERPNFLQTKISENSVNSTVIPVQMTISITQPLVYNNLPNATNDHFLSPKWKKICLKQPLQNITQQRNEKKNIREQCIKNKRLFNYIYSIATL